MPPDLIDKVYILHWEYGDKSAHGIEGIYTDEQKANEIYDILAHYDNSRNWFVDPYVVR